MTDEYLTIPEAARRLKVSVRTIERARDHEDPELRLRAFQVGAGATWRIDPADLDDWLQRRANTHRPRPATVGADLARMVHAAAVRPRAARRGGTGHLTVTEGMGAR